MGNVVVATSRIVHVDSINGEFGLGCPQHYADMNPDAPKVCVHTIPHTGTRFAMDFFHQNGTPLWHRHLYEKKVRPEWKRIVTVRNPYDCWKSWVSRRRAEFTDLEFVSMWAEFIMRTEHQDAFYFALDVTENRRQWMLSDAVRYIGAEPNRDFIKPFAERWKHKGVSLKKEQRDAIAVPDDVRVALRFADDWYRHYTEDWGEHVRNPANMLGEDDGRA